jgi:uncharacterized protein YciI
MEFLVIARDGTDAEALSRRLAAREAHLAGVKGMKQDGRLLVGGAILDDADKMIGSACVVDFPDRAALQHWLDTDPYTTGDVWKTFEIIPMRVAKV